MRVLVVMLLSLSVCYAGDMSDTDSWSKLGEMQFGGGRGVEVDVLGGSVRLVRGKLLGGDQFSDVLVGRFRLGEQWNVIVPVEVCKDRVGNVSVIDTEVLRLYPGLSNYDVQTLLTGAAVGGSGNVRLIDLEGEVVDPVALSVKWLCDEVNWK